MEKSYDEVRGKFSKNLPHLKQGVKLLLNK